MKKFIIISLSLFLVTGCASLFDKKEQAEVEVKQVDNELGERNKQLVTAVKDITEISIKHSKAQNVLPTKEIQLIDILSAENQRIVGLPIQRLPVAEMLEDLEKAKTALKTYEARNTELLQSKNNLQAEIEVLKVQIKQEKSHWFGNMVAWFMGLGTTGIIVCIVLCIFCPAIGFPLLQFVIGRMITLFPKLISFFGVVGKDVIDAVIKGYESVKDLIGNTDFFEKKIAMLPEDHLFTKSDVQDYLADLKGELLEAMKGKMKEASDHKGAINGIIEQRKVDLRLK